MPEGDNILFFARQYENYLHIGEKVLHRCDVQEIFLIRGINDRNDPSFRRETETLLEARHASVKVNAFLEEERFQNGPQFPRDVLMILRIEYQVVSSFYCCIHFPVFLSSTFDMYGTSLPAS